MSASSVAAEPFTTETNGRGEVLYKVGDALVAATFPSPAPWAPHAWHTALFDPFGAGHAGATASEKSAKAIAEMFARLAAKAAAL